MPRMSRYRPSEPLFTQRMALDELLWQLDEEAEMNQRMADYLNGTGDSPAEAKHYAVRAEVRYRVIRIIDDMLNIEQETKE